MKTSVKGIFFLPGMVATKDSLVLTLPRKDTCNQPEFWLFTTTVTYMIYGKKNNKAKFLVLFFSPHHLFQTSQLLHLVSVKWHKTWTSCSSLIVTTWFFQDPFYMLLTLVIKHSFSDWMRMLLCRFASGKKTQIQLDGMKNILGSLLTHPAIHLLKIISWKRM